jgi:transcriptional regulator with XRE-family HTH domain
MISCGTVNAADAIPAEVYRLPVGERIRWARNEHARLSHDRLVARLGRSNRGHLIKIERGDHVPRQDLRDAIADALGVPRDLFADDAQEVAAASGGPFRDTRGGAADGGTPDRARGDGTDVKDAA